MLGILGGTFDPVHFGHLRTGVEVREALGLDEVRFVPARRPPHRGLPQATARQRAEMVRRALAGTPGLVCDGRELAREGPSYTVDTLDELRHELGDTPLCLIVGADAFAGLTTWHRWQRLSELAHLVVVHRPGWQTILPESARDHFAPRLAGDADALHARPAGLLWFQPVTSLSIAASAIRQAVAAGRNIRFLVPGTVEEYIREHGLYRDAGLALEETGKTHADS